MSNYKVAVQLNYFDMFGIDCGEDRVMLEYSRLPSSEGGTVRTITRETHKNLEHMPAELAIRLRADAGGVLHLIMPDPNVFSVVRQADLTEPNLRRFRAATPFMLYDKERNEGKTQFVHGLRMFNADVIRPEDIHYIGYKFTDPVGDFAIACTASGTINSALIHQEQCWTVVTFKVILDEAAPPVRSNLSAGGKAPSVAAVDARAHPYGRHSSSTASVIILDDLEEDPVPSVKVPPKQAAPVKAAPAKAAPAKAAPVKAPEAPRSALSSFTLSRDKHPAEVSLLDDALRKLEAIRAGSFAKGGGGHGL